MSNGTNTEGLQHRDDTQEALRACLEHLQRTKRVIGNAIKRGQAEQQQSGDQWPVPAHEELYADLDSALLSSVTDLYRLSVTLTHLNASRSAFYDEELRAGFESVVEDIKRIYHRAAVGDFEER